MQSGGHDVAFSHPFFCQRSEGPAGLRMVPAIF